MTSDHAMSAIALILAAASVAGAGLSSTARGQSGRGSQDAAQLPCAGGGGGIRPGGPPITEADWRTLVCEWFPQLADPCLRQVTWPVIEAHRDYIAGQLEADVTADSSDARR